MQWRRIARKLTKWTCTLGVVLIASAWATSSTYLLRYNGRAWTAQFYAGALMVFEEPSRRPYWSVGALTNPVKDRSTQWSFRLMGGPPVVIVVPLWAPLLVAAITASVLWPMDHRADRRGRVGRCPKCGYDRRGLAADAKCPECGTVPTP